MSQQDLNPLILRTKLFPATAALKWGSGYTIKGSEGQPVLWLNPWNLRTTLESRSFMQYVFMRSCGNQIKNHVVFHHAEQPVKMHDLLARLMSCSLLCLSQILLLRSQWPILFISCFNDLYMCVELIQDLSMRYCCSKWCGPWGNGVLCLWSDLTGTYLIMRKERSWTMFASRRYMIAKCSKPLALQCKHDFD